MTDLSIRSLREEPPSAARTASGGSFSSTSGALGEALLSHSAASEDNNASPSAAVTPHPPAALPLCGNCLTEVDEDFYCSGCSKQLPLICASGAFGARNAQGEGRAPQATLPGLTRTPRTPQPGRTT